MTTTKIAISLEQDLLSQISEIASSMNISRSRAFALAAEEFVKRRRADQITQQLNEAYADGPDEEDKEMLRQMRATHRRIAGPEW